MAFQKKKRDVFHSPRLLELKKKKKKAIRFKALIFISSLAVVLVFLFLIARSPKININAIEVSGNEIIESQQIKKVAEEKIGGYYLWFLPKANFIFYPRKGIEKELMESFKRLK